MEKEKISLLGKHGHNYVNLVCILGLVVSFVFVQIFNVLIVTGTFKNYSNVTEVSNKYELTISPEVWTLSIWVVIYSFIAATLVFYIVTIFKQNMNGYIYTSPVIASPLYCAIYIINLILHIVWMLLWDQEKLFLSSHIQWMIVITNILSMAIVARNIKRSNTQLRDEQPKIYWTYIVLSFNGQGIYAAWAVIAYLINFTVCLRFDDYFSMELSGIVYLSLVLTVIVGWTILDLMFLDQFTRFLIAPYLVTIWAFAGTLGTSVSDSDPEMSDLTRNFLRGLMVMTVILLVLKLCMLLFRERQKAASRTEFDEKLLSI